MSNLILTAENYFSPEANNYYMSASQFKMFAECESMALASLRGEYERETTTALLVGSYVDAYFSGELPLFKAHHPEIYTLKGELKTEYRHAEYMIARIERDEMFMAALNGPKQVIMTGEIEGVPVKMKADVLLPDRTVDMKMVKDFNDVWSDDDHTYVPWWKFWRYDIQGAIYQEIRRQNEGERKPFGIAGATKEKEPDIGLFGFPRLILDAALEEVRANIVYYDGLKSGIFEPTECGKCPVCRSRKKLYSWATL
ncbi:MAG: PD-(D/E)XK nuclease-like domain-containing protein [Eubacteriales bacterium]